MFGMHANAEIGYLTNEGIAIFTTIQDVQGDKGGGDGGDIGAVTPIITNYLNQLPNNLDML